MSSAVDGPWLMTDAAVDRRDVERSVLYRATRRSDDIDATFTGNHLSAQPFGAAQIHWHITAVNRVPPIHLTFCWWWIDIKKLNCHRETARRSVTSWKYVCLTRSVAAGFGRHGMPPPASSDKLRLITWPCDLDLWPWRSWRLWLMRVVVLHLCTKFEVRRSCRSEDMAHDVCEH